MRLIKYHRLVMGLSQQELADKVNVGQPKISALENGDVRVSRNVLKEIADVLNFKLPIDKLIEFCEQDHSPIAEKVNHNG